MKWQNAKFADVAEIVTGNTPPKKDPDNYGDGIPWVKPPDLDGWDPIAATAETLSPKGQKLARILPVGTVMVCCIGSIGRVGIAGTKLATNQQINSLIFGRWVEPRFGYHYCRLTTSQFQAAARNAVVPILNKSNFSKLTMPVPPLSEQRRIVEILDQADALRKKRAEADAKAARILPALFYKMFGDPATNPADWPVMQLGDLGEIVTGTTPRRAIVEHFGGHIPWAKPSDLDAGIVDQTTEYLTEGGANVVRLLPAKSVMVCCIGSIGKVGFAAIPMATNQQINSVTFSRLVAPEYGFQCLEMLALTLTRMAGAVTVPIVKKSLFATLSIPVPPKELQLRYALFWQHHWNTRVMSRVRSRRLDELFALLLHRAFTGDLTSKWREAHMKEILKEMEIQSKILGTLNTANNKKA